MKTYSTPIDLLLMDELCKAVVFLGVMTVELNQKPSDNQSMRLIYFFVCALPVL